MTQLAFSWIDKDQVAASDLPVDEADFLWLYEQGIRAIVTLTEDPLQDLLQVPSDFYENHGYTLLHAPIKDMGAPKDLNLAYQVANFINKMKAENKPVLVHCLAGVGRTGMMLHAYYMIQGMSLDDAILKIREAHPMSDFSELTEVQAKYVRNLEQSLKEKD